MNSDSLPATTSPADETPGSGLSVPYLGYDSECGWAIEVARAGQLTDGGPAPSPKDLPADVREFLIDWLKQGRTA